MKSSLFLKQLPGTLLFFALIFLSAGRLIYWQGLIYMATGPIMMVLGFTVLRLDPELAKERGKPCEGANKWSCIPPGKQHPDGRIKRQYRICFQNQV